MGPRLRKAALTAHVVTSVGWFGAVVAFLALALVGLMGPNAELVRAVYLAMNVITATAIVPLAFTSLVTGVVSSLGTEWGLFRHYWVVLKLILTVVATIILIMHSSAIAFLADAALMNMLTADLRTAQLQLVVASSGTLVVLLLLTVLSMYKPRGRTPYGWHVLRRAQPSADLR